MKKSRRGPPGWIYSLLITGVLAGFAIWRGGVFWGSLAAFLAGVATFCVYSIGKANRKERGEDVNGVNTAEAPSRTDAAAIAEDGRRAMIEMRRLQVSIKDSAVRERIDRLIDVSNRIVKDAAEDPSDVPRIRKFLDYYLPTTIKLLNAYDRMCQTGGEGENVARSKKSIEDMLDTAVEAYEKQLDALFDNQAMDIETDIHVMSSLLAREGLTPDKGYDDIILNAARSGAQAGSAAAAMPTEE